MDELEKRIRSFCLEIDCGDLEVILSNVRALSKSFDVSYFKVGLNSKGEFELNLKDKIYIYVLPCYGSFVSIISRKVINCERFSYTSPPLKLIEHVNKLNKKIDKKYISFLYE